MLLTAEGMLAKQFWIQIPEHSKNVGLDEFVVMPNHIHGIIRILDPLGNNEGFPYPFLENDFEKEDGYLLNFYNQEESFSLALFYWHVRFYDRIVRYPGELERIKWYIRMNPKKWNNS